MFSSQMCELSDESQKLLTKIIEYFNLQFNQLSGSINSGRGISYNSNTFDNLSNNPSIEPDNEVKFMETLDMDLIENSEAENGTRMGNKSRINILGESEYRTV